MLRHLDLIEQVGVTIQHFEQLDQRQRQLGFAVLEAGEGMVAAVAEGKQRPQFSRPAPGRKAKWDVDFLCVQCNSCITLLWWNGMPVLQRFGSVSLRMYADDHRPPHFHIVAPDFQVLVRISDLKVIAGEARPSQIAEALAWAQSHQAALALRWTELNERE